MELGIWNSWLPRRKIRWMFRLKCGVMYESEISFHIYCYRYHWLSVDRNCQMEMQGCIFCFKPGVGLMLAHRHHPVSTGHPANAMHRGVVVTANAAHWVDVGLMLGRRLRRWPSIAGVFMLGHRLRRWPGTGSTVV